MRSVKIDKQELLKIVRENKEKHVKEYAESVNDYKAAVIKIAIENLEVAQLGIFEKMQKLQSFPPVPASYEDNYARAIRMLELSVEDVIELEDEIFNQLVLDEWHWKHGFMATSALYKSYHN